MMTRDRNTVTSGQSILLSIGGLLSMAAALGIGRFVYTPILPAMLDALGWSKAQAGLIASANFVGYLVGALIASRKAVSANPRLWLLGALTISGVTTAAIGLADMMTSFIGLRFLGGIASAFVIVCASTLVLEQLAATGQRQLSAVHFSGVGVGIFVSAALVAGLLQQGVGWAFLWMGAGLLATALVPLVAWLTSGDQTVGVSAAVRPRAALKATLGKLIVAYGLFGFGYVITATFLVTIVRQSQEIRSLEPWIWMLFGLAAVPSVSIWTSVGARVGVMKAFAFACVVEAIGISASVEFQTVAGVCLAATFLGGTFMGLTALGLVGARELSAGEPHRAVALMTASFAIGQMLGPPLAGKLFDQLGSFRVASLVASSALIVAALLVIGLGTNAAPTDS